MSEELETSEAPNLDFYRDLVKALNGIPHIAKTGFNPHLKSSYVTLDEILTVVKPILSANNICLIQDPWTSDGFLCVQTMLVHTSGQVQSSAVLRFAIPDSKPQTLGGLLSYSRRYQLMTYLGLAGDIDIDAIESKESKGATAAAALKAKMQVKKVEVINDDI